MNSVHHSRLARGVLAGYLACLVAIAVGLLQLGSPAAFAQSIFANLSGTVTDSVGALVPGATVKVENAESKAIRHYVTNSSGFFSATELPTGTYTVTVEMKGFEKWQGTGIVLKSSDDKSMTIPLKVGTESTTVEVNADSSDIAINDTGAKIVRIDSKDLDNLSLVGRNAFEVLKILPGAAQITNGGTNRPGYTGEIIGINGTVGGSTGGLSGVSLNGQSRCRSLVEHGWAKRCGSRRSRFRHTRQCQPRHDQRNDGPNLELWGRQCQRAGGD